MQTPDDEVVNNYYNIIYIAILIESLYKYIH